jgi:beta-glucosidase
LVITENGAAFPDVVTVEAGHESIADNDRANYLRAHVLAVGRARARGADVHGYFVWSLFDNFEWNLGYSQRFGIIRIDYETLRRIPKASASWFSELASTHRVPAPLDS